MRLIAGKHDDRDIFHLGFVSTNPKTRESDSGVHWGGDSAGGATASGHCAEVGCVDEVSGWSGGAEISSATTKRLAEIAASLRKSKAQG